MLLNINIAHILCFYMIENIFLWFYRTHKVWRWFKSNKKAIKTWWNEGFCQCSWQPGRGFEARHLRQGARIFVVVSIMFLLLAVIGLYEYFIWDPSCTLFRALNTWLSGEENHMYNQVPPVDQVSPLATNISSINADQTHDDSQVWTFEIVSKTNLTIFQGKDIK